MCAEKRLCLKKNPQSEKINNIAFDKHFLVLLFYVFFITNVQSQADYSTVLNAKNKVIHSFGIYMNNGIYLPEKIHDNYGLIKRIPQTRYGYEFAFNYNPVIYKGFGLSLDLII